MNLTLEVTGANAAALGPARRKVFAGSGGTIGRAAGNQWVLQHQFVSSRHAVIHYEDGVYTIEDHRSSNGVFVNSVENRLPVGERYVLKNGDTLYIDPFEIHVTLVPDPRAAPSPDPFSLTDFFTPAPGADVPPPVSPGSTPSDDSEWFKLLGPDPAAPSAPAGPRADDLNRGSVLNEHYRPPAPAPVPGPAPAPPADDSGGSTIPEDWDKSVVMPSPIPVPRPGPRHDRVTRSVPPTPPQSSPFTDSAVRPPRPQPGSGPPAREAASPVAPIGPGPAEAAHRPEVPAPPVPPPASAPERAATVPGVRDAAGAGAQLDLSQLLAGAGLDPADVTPELARAFGQILRVVVSGLIDVMYIMRSFKEEFRLKNITRFERANNNPLKFSANVEDALHNLLVKRNAGYLGPVESFEDAFGDLRNHQMAMLAGIRVAFDAMLAEFEPDRLQQDFDRQIKKGALLSVPAKLRYWDLYREKFGDMVRDAETSFAELFGEDFARAYEEQLERLKAQSRSGKR
jgi:type VI secretion system FHA domain protein